MLTRCVGLSPHKESQRPQRTNLGRQRRLDVLVSLIKAVCSGRAELGCLRRSCPGKFSCRVYAANGGRKGQMVVDDDRCASGGDAIPEGAFPCITGASATPELRGLVCGFVGSEAYRPGSGRRDWPHGCRRGQCLMVLTGRKSGRDLVIERVLPSVDAVGVDDADPSQPAVRSGGLRRAHRRVRLSPS
jgi:hypothetical protein